MKEIFLFLLALVNARLARTDEVWDNLWLQKSPLPSESPASMAYLASLQGGVVCQNQTSPASPLVTACVELQDAISDALGVPVPLTFTDDNLNHNVLWVRATTANERGLRNHSSDIAEEAFRVYWGDDGGPLTLESPSGRGALFGAFRFISHLRRETIPVVLESDTSGAMIDPSWEGISDSPLAPLRIWQLWDNLDGTIERGYGGASLVHWEELPSVLRPRLFEFARLLASVGINAIALSNVNSCDSDNGNALLLSSSTLEKAGALASVFAQYGIASFLTPCFSSPMIDGVGNLSTADPLDPAVQEWWRSKVADIADTFRTHANDAASSGKDIINTFGGFLMKADSEGLPGPSTYNRSEPDGASLLADALSSPLPWGGETDSKDTDAVLLWRAFSHPGDITNTSGDQPLMQWQIFTALDGMWPANMVLQIKHGPMDFQVHEPVHSLFGQLPKTSLMVELGVAHEYTGQAWHICHLPSMWDEYLAFDTQCDSSSPSSRSTLADIVTGRTASTAGYRSNGFAGVSNFGDDESWTGHPFSAANTFGFGRLAWNPINHTAEEITREWAELTFPTLEQEVNADASLTVAKGSKLGEQHLEEYRSVARTVETMLLSSWETFENYTSPYGLGAVVSNCKSNPHFCPDGWEQDFYSSAGKFDHYWLNLSLWKYALKECTVDPVTGDSECEGNAGYGGGFNASVARIGNNRSLAYGATYCGTNADTFASPETTPRRLLLTFHNLPWNMTVYAPSAVGRRSGEGKPLLLAITDSYRAGVESAASYVKTWEALRHGSPSTRTFARKDPRYHQVEERLVTAAIDAQNFTETALAFFAGYQI